MVVALAHPASLMHRPPGHPERPARIEAILDALAGDPDLKDLAVEQPELDPGGPVPGAGRARRLASTVHDPGYVEAIFALGERIERRGEGGWIDGDTFIGPGTLEAVCASVDCAGEAVRRVLAEPGAAFSFCRPPGHHARPRQAMGFCFFNNIAAAAQSALDAGMSRVAIVDFDVHHGNGTQDIFYERGDVLYVSTHQWPEFPGTGAADERGRGAGEGCTINLPLAAGTGDAGYFEVFDERVMPALDSFAPELLLVSAGFDAHAADPIADMELSTEGFGALARRLLDAATRLCGGRSAWILEGGYDLQALGESAAGVVREACQGP